MPKFNVEVELVGKNGNAFAIMAEVQRGLRKAKATQEDINKFMDEAMSGDYNNLLKVCCEWVEVC